MADSKNHRIQVFTADGEFVKMFGKQSLFGWGGRITPICLAIDSDGIVYVSKHSNHRVSVFNSEGQFLTSFGDRGEKLGELKYSMCST